MSRPVRTGRGGLSGAIWPGMGSLVLATYLAATDWGLPSTGRSSGRRADRDPAAGWRDRDEYGSPVWCLAVAPGGTMLGLSTIRGEVWIKDLATGHSGRVASGPTASARSLAFAPDGRIMAVAGIGAAVRLWDVERGQLFGSIPVQADLAKTVAFAPDGRLLAVGESPSLGRGHVSLWDWRAGRRLRTLDADSGGINVLAFSADGAVLAMASSLGVARLWEVATGREVASIPASRSWSPIALALSPDGKRLATSGLCEREVRLWDSAGRPGGVIAGMNIPVWSLAFSPDGRLLAVACQDGTVSLWDGSGGREPVSVRRQSAAVRSVIFSTDGKTLATGGEDGSVRLWDVPSEIGHPSSARR